MDNVNDTIHYNDFKDKDTALLLPGDKVFTDSDTTGLWRVYEKQDPYNYVRQLSPNSTVANQDFGFRIVARNDGRTIVVSSPTHNQGFINFLFRNTPSGVFQNQGSVTTTAGDDNTGRLGYSLSMSTDENFVVAGAPYTNTLDQDGSTRQLNAGLIKVYIWDPSTFKYGILNTITPPTDGSTANENLNFGWNHKISEPGGSSVRSTADKYLFVSAPGHDSDRGRIYMYTWGIGADGSTYDTWTQDLTIESPAGGSGQRFGHRIAANDNGDIIAISSISPGNAGKVEIFVRTTTSNDDSTNHTFALAQTLRRVAPYRFRANYRHSGLLCILKAYAVLTYIYNS